MKFGSYFILFSVFIVLILGGRVMGESPTKIKIETDSVKLLKDGKNFIVKFVEDGKIKQMAVQREWLIPKKDEEFDEEMGAIVSSFQYNENVTSFSIGNGQTGLHISSYGINDEGSANAGSGRDVFLIYDSKSSKLSNGTSKLGLKGVTQERGRGEFGPEADSKIFLISDINGDGLTDTGIIEEKIYYDEKAHTKYFEQMPIKWFLFKKMNWEKGSSYIGEIPKEYLELPLIASRMSPVDYVGDRLWGNDLSKWPSKNKKAAIFVPSTRISTRIK